MLQLPGELLNPIIELLGKKDLQALSQVSKYANWLVAELLWQSVTIRPSSELKLYCLPSASFPPSRIPLIRHVHFRALFQFIFSFRCVHGGRTSHALTIEDVEEDDIDDEYNNKRRDPSRIGRLGRRAKDLLSQLDENQLESFSWDLGTCVPFGILDTDGIISCEQSHITSLSLTTNNYTCMYSKRSAIDLSSFHHLRRLSWKGASKINLPTLSAAIRNNAKHLHHLTIDFMLWVYVEGDLDFDQYDPHSEVNGSTSQNYFFEKVLRLNRKRPRILFPELRELSLGGLYLNPELAQAINFATLTSLKLQACDGCMGFLQRAARLNLPIKLKALHVQGLRTGAEGRQRTGLADFLDSFDGLEDLFVSLPGKVQDVRFWMSISQRHKSLQRFVYHRRRMFRTDVDRIYTFHERDIPTLGIEGSELQTLRDNPSLSPFATLDLKFAGLCCHPRFLKPILLPFARKTCLTMLHIRQSRLDLKNFPSWILKRPTVSRVGSPVSDDSMDQFSDTDSDHASNVQDSDETLHTDEDTDFTLQSSFRHEFLEFAVWVFGAEGTASLQYLAFGDFAYGGRVPDHNVLLCRDVQRRCQFRLLSPDDPLRLSIEHEYRDALEACPSEALLEY